MKYRNHKYTWSKPWNSVRHVWEFISVHGGITFHATVPTDSEYETAAGLELHSIYPQGDKAPDHINCQVTGGRCWHEGTSLYARETLWPLVAPHLARGEHDKIFRILEEEASRLAEYAPTELRASDGK